MEHAGVPGVVHVPSPAAVEESRDLLVDAQLQLPPSAVSVSILALRSLWH